MCLEGIEPSTSVLSGQRSTTELQTQILLSGSGQRSTSPRLAQAGQAELHAHIYEGRTFVNFKTARLKNYNKKNLWGQTKNAHMDVFCFN